MKVRPLFLGLTIYKKFNQNSLMTGKIFDPNKSKENPPESCGYAIRIFKLNTTDNILEIKNNKSKHIENKINLISIKGILLSNTAKVILKAHNFGNNPYIGNTNVKQSNEINKKNLIENVPFSLLVDDGMLDLISPSFNDFIAFRKAIEELCNKKKNYMTIFKYLDK